MSAFSFFCPCPRGLEDVLAEELGEIASFRPGLTVHQRVPGGVHAAGGLQDAWAINLHSRIASRVLLRIGQRAYGNEADIYALAHSLPWESWFQPEHRIRVDVTAIKSPLRSLEFVTLRIKDAICDRFRSQKGARPSVDTQRPDMRVFGFLDARNVTLYLDTSGEALFKRGWRLDKGDAPLRENLAAGLLRAAGWKPGVALLDPMCGSGTILIEAAQMCAGIAAGSQRRFAFEKFNGFDVVAWQAMRQPRPAPVLPDGAQIFGSDISGDMLVMARSNLARAGVLFEVPLKQIEAQEVRPPVAQPGILITNPPYGERIGVRGDARLQGDELANSFFAAFARTLKQRFSGWTVYLFTADLHAPKLLRLKESRKTPFFNGALECRLFRFDMVAGANRRTVHEDGAENSAQPQS